MARKLTFRELCERDPRFKKIVTKMDCNWIKEDTHPHVYGNVLKSISHPGAPFGSFADRADIGVNLKVYNPGIIKGKYGYLKLLTNGTYKYKLYKAYQNKSAYEKVQGLSDKQTLTEAFRYKVTNGYLKSSNILKIKVFGMDDKAYIRGLNVEAFDHVLCEANLPDGSDPLPQGGNPYVQDSFTVKATDGFYAVVLGGTWVINSKGAIASAIGTVIKTQYGEIVVEKIVKTAFDTYRIEYKYTLTDNTLDHSVKGIDVVSEKIDVKVRDSDFSLATASIDIAIKDDVPTAKLALKGGMLLIDETDGITADANEIDPLGGDLGMSMLTAAQLFDETSIFGADGQAAMDALVYELVLSGGAGADSGLDDHETMQDIFLYAVDSQTIEGRVGGEMGPVSFILTITADGKMSLTQQRAVYHDDPTDPDEAVSPALLADNLISVKLTVTDGDGDMDSVTLALNGVVKFEDDGPKAGVDPNAMIPMAVVDESSMVYTGTAGSGTDGVAMVMIAAADIQALFTTPVYGADGAGSTAYELVLTGMDVPSGLFAIDPMAMDGKGAEIVLNQDAMTGVITGTVGMIEYFTIEMAADGKITFTLNSDAPVWHALTGENGTNHDDASVLTTAAGALVVKQTVTDADLDTATAAVDLGTGNVFKFEDDGPKASVDPNAMIPMAVVDESSMVYTGTAGSGTDGVAMVMIAAADIQALFTTPVYGADGAGSTAYELVLTGMDVASGLFAIDPMATDGKGAEIVLNQDAMTGVITGTVGMTEYFTIEMAADGKITFTLNSDAPVWHALTGENGTNHDDASTLTTAAGALVVKQTVTDADLDTATATVDLGTGNVFKIEDDGPKAGVDPNAMIPMAVVDESSMVYTGTAGSGTDGVAMVMIAAADIQALFTTPVCGADGAGSTAYELVLTGMDVPSGLFAIDPMAMDGKGAEIVLNQDAMTGAITGTVGMTEYFTIEMAADGKITFTLNSDVPIWHATTNNHDDASTLTTAAGALVVKQTVTDADLDTATATIDLGTGNVFKIEDDGPKADVDTNTATESCDMDAGAVSGNVLNNDASGADGWATGGGVVGIAFGMTTGTVGTALAGDYGSLVLNADGTYTYTPSKNNDQDTNNDGVVDALDTPLVDVFTYTVRDGDGDEATATLSITVEDGEGPTTNLLGTIVTLDEDGLMLPDPDDDGTDNDGVGVVLGPAQIIPFTAGTDDISVAFGDTSGITLSGYNGNPITWTPSASGTILTGSVDGVDVVELELTGVLTAAACETVNASIKVTLLNNLLHTDGNGETTMTIEDVLITATDTDGDTSSTPLNIVVIDDVPEPENDVDTATESCDGSGVATGNVLTGVDIAMGDANMTDGVADVSGADGWATGGGVVGIAFGMTTGTVGTALAGDYGSLVLNSDGSYTYTPNKNNDQDTNNDGVVDGNDTPLVDVFTYTVRDRDGDEVTATLSVTVEDGAGPSTTVSRILATLDEDGLMLPDPDDDGTDNDGVDVMAGPAQVVIFTAGTDDISVAFGDTSGITLSGYNGNPITWTPSAGDTILTGSVDGVDVVELELTGVLTAAACETVNASIKVTLLNNVLHTDGNGETTMTIRDVLVTATDTDGDTSSIPVTLGVIDDVPEPENDVDTATESCDDSGVATGNVLTGVDIAMGDANMTDGVADVSGADGWATGGGVVGIAFGMTVGTVGTALAGDYGSLVLNSDGSYTYTPNKNNDQDTNNDGVVDGNDTPLVDVFTYTVRDGDGDEVNATLSITVEDGDGPSAMVLDFVVSVDEDGLQSPPADHPGTDNDGVDTMDATGSFKFTAGTDDITVEFGDTSGIILTGYAGPPITWTPNMAGNELVGSVSGTDVIKLELTGTLTALACAMTTVGIKATLLDNLQHSDGNFQVPLLISNILVTATDTDGDEASGAISALVTDDVPEGGISEVTATAGAIATNLMLIVDLSGSMNFASGLPGLTRLDVAKQAMTQLIDQYDALGDVMVRLVAFSSGGQEIGNVWVSAAAAKATISGMTANGSTNYDAALNAAQGAFPDAGALTGANNVSYFLSDGEPNQPGGSVGINGTEENAWENFLDNNDILSYALGMGPGVSPTSLNPIAYNGVTDTEANAIIVSNFSQLANTLVGTVSGELATGTIVANYGADGNGGMTALLTTGAPAGFSYVPDGDDIIVRQGADDIMRVTLDEMTGEYTITQIGVIDPVMSNPVEFIFTVSIEDGDGDAATTQIKLELTIPSTITPVAIDLDGDGLEFLSASDGVEFDYAGDGAPEATPWVGPDDAFLVLDTDGDRNVTETSDFAFSMMTDAEDTDLEALAFLFDTNGDGVLSAEDDRFAEFGIWQDANSNGVTDAGEFQTLTEAGIVSIGLNGDGNEYDAEGGGVHVYGEATYTKSDGSTGKVGDVAFEVIPVGVNPDDVDANLYL